MCLLIITSFLLNDYASASIAVWLRPQPTRVLHADRRNLSADRIRPGDLGLEREIRRAHCTARDQLVTPERLLLAVSGCTLVVLCNMHTFF
jgi:hypothetical protein